MPAINCKPIRYMRVINNIHKKTTCLLFVDENLKKNFFFTLSCPASFTGSRCETLLSNQPTITPKTTTSVPRCNFTIGLQNDGLYTAKFRVQYTIDGITQPVIYSPSLPFIGNTAYITIPYYAKDIIVSIERLGFQWAGIVQDSNINTAVQCTKCYKTWGVVSDPKWDYIVC